MRYLIIIVTTTTNFQMFSLESKNTTQTPTKSNENDIKKEDSSLGKLIRTK